MGNVNSKPRMVFFQCEYDANLPAFLLVHRAEHVRCLAEFFDVTVTNEDCDYHEICDKYQPDLTLFESGVPLSCRRPKIINVRDYTLVPKLGFLNADGFGEGRAGFLSDMDHWGITTAFAISTIVPDYLQVMRDNLYIWANFVDADLYRDYGQVKNIPVLFTGNKNNLYPWRQKIQNLVSRHYPSLICPHPGYCPQKVTTQFVVGEPYARLINSSWFVPACGTIAREVVRKHFEILACKACLITESSAGLEAAGFVDMENCVFASEQDVLDKLSYLFDQPEKLQAIIEAGHRLVHTRHTSKQRDQILQWLKLYKTITPNEVIIQPNPFEPLRIVDKTRAISRPHIIPNGSFLALLRQGDENLWGGEYGEAEYSYLKCLNYYRFMPEPALRLALCSLYKGDASSALSWISKPIQFTLAEYKAADPDPVEWAYFVVTLLCLGRIHDALQRADSFPWLRHPELDRVRLVTQILNNRIGVKPVDLDNGVNPRRSIHDMPARCINEWIEHLSIMLRACKQYRIADIVRNCTLGEGTFLQETERTISPNGQTHAYENGNPSMRVLEETRYAGKTSKRAVNYFKRKLFFSKALIILKRPVKNILHRIEWQVGQFLPYSISSKKNDELCHAIHDLARDEDIKQILIIGGALGQVATEAVLAGAQENMAKPSVFCISTRRHKFVNNRRKLSLFINWYHVSPYDSDTFPHKLNITINKIMLENRIRIPDLLLIDGSELVGRLAGAGSLRNQLHGARFVVLEDIDRPFNQENYIALTKDSSYVLMDYNPGLRNGYAIFEKRSRVERATGIGVGNVLQEL